MKKLISTLFLMILISQSYAQAENTSDIAFNQFYVHTGCAAKVGQFDLRGLSDSNYVLLAYSGGSSCGQSITGSGTSMDIGLMVAELKVISDNAMETRFDLQLLPYKERGVWITPENRKYIFELVATKNSFKLPDADIKYSPEAVTVYISEVDGDKKIPINQLNLDQKHIGEYNF